MSERERVSGGEPRLGPGREFDLIRRFFRDPAPEAERRAGGPADRVGPGHVVVGPGDDCTVVRAEGLAISTDLSVEDVHFRRAWMTLEETGYRAATAALSDLAAMAARPIGVLASVAAPDSDVPDGVESIMAGVRAAAEAVGGLLLGGDLARSPGPLLVDVTVVGECPEPVLRAGAQPGDSIWVTGALGAAGAAVECWRSGRVPPPAAREAFARPSARVREARWLAERAGCSALIDLSDGLAGDAGHLGAAGGVSLVIEVDRVPVHPVAESVAGSREKALGLALAGGEDYELCFCAGPGRIEALQAGFKAEFGIPLTRVGYVREGVGVFTCRAGASPEPLSLTGYRHFERAAE